MKFNIQIPTIAFGLIGVEIEGTAQDAVLAHNELIEAYRASQGGEGVTPKEFNLVYDTYITRGAFTPEMQEIYHRMNKEQMGDIQRFKRALERIKSRIDK